MVVVVATTADVLLLVVEYPADTTDYYAPGPIVDAICAFEWCGAQTTCSNMCTLTP